MKLSHSFALLVAYQHLHVARPTYERSGITSQQLRELEHLRRTIKAAADALLPSPVRDEVRLLNEKLNHLADVSGLVHPAEWDAMLKSLLAADFYGAQALIEQLPKEEVDMPADDKANSDEADDDCEAGGKPQRRRLKSLTHDETGAEDAMVARDTHDDKAEVASISKRWSRWLLDRPPPWERDCDCCFPDCPPGRNCLLQSDKLYLACRGDSVGMILEWQWDRRPLLCMLIIVATLLFALHCLIQQVCSLMHARRLSISCKTS